MLKRKDFYEIILIGDKMKKLFGGIERPQQR